MKVLACIVLALAVFATAEEEKKDKRFVGLGYGAYPYSYGYPYNYPYTAPIAYTAPIVKTGIIPEKVTAYTVPKVSTVWPYSSSVLPYSGILPYSVPSYSGAWPYSGSWSSPYYYGYPYAATKLIK